MQLGVLVDRMVDADQEALGFEVGEVLLQIETDILRATQILGTAPATSSMKIPSGHEQPRGHPDAPQFQCMEDSPLVFCTFCTIVKS